ncbi:hypothetical protein BGZ60DRAFT_437097 [Tricladium varicosporioides]|nr:hypothetical protein BGZ60DRAFT_437097 [Hymenoscyphus varicosporioides]
MLKSDATPRRQKEAGDQGQVTEVVTWLSISFPTKVRQTVRNLNHFNYSNHGHPSRCPAPDLSIRISATTQSEHAGRVGRVDRAPFLPYDFDCDLYIPIRLYDLASEDKEMLTGLVDLEAGQDEILCILETENESFELGVLKTYIPELKKLLDTRFPQHLVDWEHRPFDPSLKDVKSFCAKHPELSDDYTKAKARMTAQFCKRAEGIIRDGWDLQKIWYSHLVGLVPK